MLDPKRYMLRCFQLAQLAGKDTKSNPKVGAVIVHKAKVIGEGYHEKYGGAHAEVNALRSVKKEHLGLIPDSTLYVSLEPCNIDAKTPPCAVAIINSGIKKVVVSTLDPNPAMQGASISYLREQGLEIITGVLQDKGDELLGSFRANLARKPYVILKFAQSSDAYLGKRGKQVWLTSKETGYLTHKWRSEIDGILVGHNTVIADNPSLTTRHISGDNPLRIVLTDSPDELTASKLSSDKIPTLFVGTSKPSELAQNKYFLPFDRKTMEATDLLKKLYDYGIYTLMVEGGAKTLKYFIDADLWDETRIITAPIALQSGIRAPMISGKLTQTIAVSSDHIKIIHNVKLC